MRKVLLVLLILLSAASIGFGIYNYMEYEKLGKKITRLKTDIVQMQMSIKDEEKLKKEIQEKYEKFLNDNKDKLEEYKKWQEEIKKVKELL